MKPSPWGNPAERMAYSLSQIFDPEATEGCHLNTPEGKQIHDLVVELGNLHITLDSENSDYQRSREIIEVIHRAHDRSMIRSAFNYLSAAWVRKEEEFILADFTKSGRYNLTPLCLLRSMQLGDPKHDDFVMHLRAA